MFEGSYPPWVTGAMIDHYAGEDNLRRCKNCLHYNGRYCTKNWNNLEEDYLIPERDEVEPEDFCDEFESYEEEVQ